MLRRLFEPAQEESERNPALPCELLQAVAAQPARCTRNSGPDGCNDAIVDFLPSRSPFGGFLGSLRFARFALHARFHDNQAADKTATEIERGAEFDAVFWRDLNFTPENMPDAVADEPDRFPHFILLAHSKNVLGKLIDQRFFEAFPFRFRADIRDRVILHGFFSVRFQINRD